VKRKPTSWPCFLAIVTLFATVGACTWVVVRDLRQDRLDRSLILAVKRWDVARVQLLLEQGANSEARDTPPPPGTLIGTWRWIANRWRNPVAPADTPSAMQTAMCPWSLLSQDSYIADDTVARYKIIKLLVAHGANVNTKAHKDLEIDTACPLYLANNELLGEFHDDTIRFLLAHCADVDCRNSAGWTTLMSASWSHDLATANVLIRAGANVNVESFDPETKEIDTALSLTRHEHKGGNVDVDEPMRDLLLKHGARR
jgi:hypothetical protein